MDDCPEVELKKLCCTCLSRDRKLFQLCRLPDGVNNLYLLLSFDSEAYREGFYKDTASLYMCWECRAVMCRITRFRKQACAAQRELTSIVDGRTHIQTTSLSRLTSHHTTTYQKVISESNATSQTDNFIDCGLTTDIKSESEEDIPLSELHGNWLSDHETEVVIPTTEFKDELSISKEELCNSKDTINCKEDLLYRYKKKRKKKKDGFSTVVMTDTELGDIRDNNRMSGEFVEAQFKCQSCVVAFGSQEEFDKHNSSLHVEKPDHLQCDICLVYINITTYHDHRETHYHRHICQLCVHTAYDVKEMLAHLWSGHAVKDLSLPGKRKKTRHKTIKDLNPVSGTQRKPSMLDKRTPYGYLCTECNKYFENKNQRWKHVQRHHREGYKCSTCGKRFAFKNNLTRHEQLHLGPPPREECPVCHKMIRCDLLKVHSRIHSDRQRFSCAACTKCFVSRASYEHHLKYTQAHAQADLHKHKCTMCDKGYRSRGELRDHVNYQHMGKTQHKCPICGKALATRRCVTRHMRRAHDGVKETARDKICQQCGKAFRDKKGLREHELIHTGERPLSCEICGCTFRQSASLYTHRKRVHKIFTSVKKFSEGDGIPLWLCWECDAQMNRFTKFKRQVKTSYSLFYDYVKENTNLSKLQPTPRLTTNKIYNISLQEDIATEPFTIIKTEQNLEQQTSLENQDEYTDTIDNNSDDEKLINVKQKKKNYVNRIILATKRRKKKRNRKAVELFKEIELSREDLMEERRVAMLKDDYVNAMFRCERCILSFPNAEDLKDHVSVKHELNSNNFKCDICECCFATEVSYNYHTNKHKRRYECRSCSERYVSQRSVVKHYETVHYNGPSIELDVQIHQQKGGITDDADDKRENSTKQSSATFNCEYCDKSFRWKASLRKHVEAHRIETGQKRKPYCEPCRLSFSNTSNLQKHVKTSSKHQIQLKLRKLTETLPEDTSNPEKHQQRIDQIRSSVNTSKEQYPCPQCDKKFQWRGNLLRHLKSHVARANGELVCEPCNRTFSSIATYKQHMKISRKHVSENDFKYMCSDCGKRFANKTRLKDHVNWEHLKNYVHICSVCQKVFKSHTSLYLHKQVVHNKDNADHLCDHCGKAFQNQAKLRSHQLAIHSAHSYACVTCGARFSWLSCLKRHSNKLHQSNTPRHDK